MAKKKKSRNNNKNKASSPARSVSPVSPDKTRPETPKQSLSLPEFNTPKLEPETAPEEVSPLSARATPQKLSKRFSDETESPQTAISSPVPGGDAKAPVESHTYPATPTETPENNAMQDSDFDKLADELDDDDENVEFVIPERSVARDVEPDSAELMQATREPLHKAQLVEVKDVNDETPKAGEAPKADEVPKADVNDDFDPDTYFSGSEDEIINAQEPDGAGASEAPVDAEKEMNPSEREENKKAELSDVPAEPELQEVPGEPELQEVPGEPELLEVPGEPELHEVPGEPETPAMPSPEPVVTPADDGNDGDNFDFGESNSPLRSSPSTARSSHRHSQKGMIRRVSTPNLEHEENVGNDKDEATGMKSPLASPEYSPVTTEPRKRYSSIIRGLPGDDVKLEPSTGSNEADENDDLNRTEAELQSRKTRPSPLPLGSPKLSSHAHVLSSPIPELGSSSNRQGQNQQSGPGQKLQSLVLDSPSSPFGSPRPYKYTQSPLPRPGSEDRPDPPIFGVCVVGFHHLRGPEVEYWVGPDRSHSKIWPYLPFQSLPDGSHQFEENICYFTLLYDRNQRAATSLTYNRDESGNIKEGTSDFRNVTTLFAIACSRQLNVDELDNVSSEEEYTRTVVQKSVVVIASKPIFGPIKEKLTVVTRSYFQQKNFSDRSIIDHFYDNMMQMPLWLNENDLQVGMNLQRFVHDFGSNVLVILKAMILERKILFYAQDTDILGTTQFALISLIPNLISHLEDSGSPLLSSYELKLRTPQTFIPGDRSSLIDFMGFPLQLFAGGGLFNPFVPLQQFEELRQPETRYGLVGTTNNLFLGTEIDFDLVVNIDTKELQIRNNELSPLLKLSDADSAFIDNIKSAVNSAWDAEETWQPESLGYYGGEDYIRHEFEEYLLALLASAKYARLSSTQIEKEQEVKTQGSPKPSSPSQAGRSGEPSPNESGNADSDSSPVEVTHPGNSTSSNSGSVDDQGEEVLVPDASQAKIKEVISPWNRQWVEHWMQNTNNFRIFDRHTVPYTYKAVERSHPGLKYIKPSGFAKFLGLFKPKSSTEPVASPTSQSPTGNSLSSVATPVVDQGAEFEPRTPQHLTHMFPEQEN